MLKRLYMSLGDDADTRITHLVAIFLLPPVPLLLLGAWCAKCIV